LFQWNQAVLAEIGHSQIKTGQGILEMIQPDEYLK